MKWYKNANPLKDQYFSGLWEKARDLVENEGTDGCEMLLGEIEDIKIKLVDGDKVKVDCSMDFVEGGHDAVYDFIPEKEVWVDSHIDLSDAAYILYHELIERRLMDEYGFTYEKAHEIANSMELEQRRNSEACPETIKTRTRPTAFCGIYTDGSLVS